MGYRTDAQLIGKIVMDVFISIFFLLALIPKLINLGYIGSQMGLFTVDYGARMIFEDVAIGQRCEALYDWF